MNVALGWGGELVRCRLDSWIGFAKIVTGSVYAIFAVSLAASDSRATGAYCVTSARIERVAAALPARSSVGPAKFELNGKADTPVALDTVKVQAIPSGYFLRSVLWRLGEKGRLIGPYDLSDSEVIGSDGETVYLQRGRNRTDTPLAKEAHDGKGWEQRILAMNPGELPILVGGKLDRDDWHGPRGHYDPDLRGVVASMYYNPPEGFPQHETFLIRGRSVTQLPDGWWSARLRSAQWNLAVDASGYDIRLLDQTTLKGVKLELPQTDDNERWYWESVNVDRDGWLFVEGNGNDYAIELQRDAQGIRAGTIYKYTGYERSSGWLGWLSGFFGSRFEHTYHSNQCVNFSPVLQRTLFCRPSGILRDGRLEDMGEGTGDLRNYVGDATSAGVAIFDSLKGNELYASDGSQVQRVASGLGRWIAVNDLPSAQETFIVSGGRSFRLTGKFPNLSLTKIDLGDVNGTKLSQCCLSLGPLFSHTVFRTFPGTTDILAFTTDSGVWQLAPSGTKQIGTTKGSQIDLNSVANVKIWDGMAFITADKKVFRVSRCGADLH